MSALAIVEHDMARKSAPPPEPPKQGVVITLKAEPSVVPAWRAWLAELGEHVGAPASVVVDMALREFAAARGFTPKPPKRTAR